MKKLLFMTLIISLFLVSACEKCREISEPYETIEEYTEQEPYTEEQCEYQDYNYEIEDVTSTRVGDNVRLEYDVVNRDTEVIEFRGGADWVLGESAVYERFDPKVCCQYTVEPGSRITVKRVYEDAPNGLKGVPNVIMPQREVCGTVTKYRTVTKNRTVTKYRNKTVCG